MRKIIFILLSAITFASCGNGESVSYDANMREKQAQIISEGDRQIGMPAIKNYQEKKNLKWIYELCDQEDLVCYAYLFNEMKGEVGQYLGECIGYGIPYSTQFSNSDKVVDYGDELGHNLQATGNLGTLPQCEPNGLFKPTGLSATWLILLDPKTKKPRPVYVEPMIIVSPFKLK